MADSTVGMLPRASQVDDDSLLLMEQQGTAMNFTGKQLKDYAKAGLEANFADDIKAANDAADRAVDAVKSVTEMTVEAHASDEATVKKTMKDGKVNLDFGLPRGEHGVPGEKGEIGPRGPKGDPGSGLKVLGYYDNEQALRDAVKSPEVGDAYGVGTEPPYDIYVFDGVTEDWKNNGPFSGGGGGGEVPKNVVTADGGGELVMEGGIKEGPYKVIFTDEEEPPLTAEDVEYNDGTVKDALEQLFTSVADGKKKIASAVSDKGVPTEEDATFQQMADNIRGIESGADTSDATATPGDILAGKTAYVKGGKVEGLIPSLQARTIMPTTQEQTLSAGNYLAGTQVIRGDTNLQPVNIRKGVTLFGVNGAMESSFQATLTVTVDAGAVVTATHSDKVTKVEALSPATGKVTLELPLEGQWTVTAQRGVAQYNSVVINVSSSYTATLTAELHIVYFGQASSLQISKKGAATASIGNYAIFFQGLVVRTNTSSYWPTGTIDCYDVNLTHSTKTNYSSSSQYPRSEVAGASNAKYAFFAGGYDDSKSPKAVYNYVDSFDENLTIGECTGLSETRRSVSGTSVGKYAIFSGGYTTYSSNTTAKVETYDESKTKGSATDLPAAGKATSASNGNYAIIYVNSQVVSYDSSLTRTILSTPRAASSYAARAGNYVVFFNRNNMYAYDMFLTQTNVESASVEISAATTLKDYALFGGILNGTSINVYDAYLTKTNPSGISGKNEMSAASVGNYAIFAGGATQNAAFSQLTSDAYAYQYK